MLVASNNYSIVALGSPSLDLDPTIFIQFGLFICLMIFLNFTLYKPYLKMRQERENLTEGARNKAIELNEQAQKLEAELKQKQLHSFSQVENERKHQLMEANNKASQIIDEVRQKTQNTLKQHRSKLQQDIDASRKEAQSQAEQLSELMANKLLGDLK